LFDRELLLQLSRRERRVLIVHEVSHLAPECQLLGRRIYREIYAHVISLQLVPLDDVAAMLAKSIVMFPYYPAQKELIYRFTVIQEFKVASGELELARIMHRFSLRSDESADLTRHATEAPANVLLSTLRRPTECNAGRADDFVAAVENLCIIRAKDHSYLRPLRRLSSSAQRLGPAGAESGIKLLGRRKCLYDLSVACVEEVVQKLMKDISKTNRAKL